MEMAAGFFGASMTQPTVELFRLAKTVVKTHTEPGYPRRVQIEALQKLQSFVTALEHPQQQK